MDRLSESGENKSSVEVLSSFLKEYEQLVENVSVGIDENNKQILFWIRGEEQIEKIVNFFQERKFFSYEGYQFVILEADFDFNRR